MDTCYDLFETAWGWVAAVASPRGICALSLPCPTAQEALQKVWRWLAGARRDASALAQLRERLSAYLEGDPISLDDLQVDIIEDAPPFFRRAWEACRRIPRGQVRTYAWLAREVGRPGAARAAGQAMARNPLPILVPCHRVLGSDGGLHGYGGGLDMKARLLALEGWKGCQASL
ncbi:MAG: methylated-DNA--[protein]-cysteine S-methyltransferase [Dehalococcoidia bacterium]